MKQSFLLTLIFILAFSFSLKAQDSPLPTPESYFGFQPGADRELINYDPLIKYLQVLANQSPRIAIEQIGTSPLGLPMYAVFLSAEENIRNLDQLKKINQDLALNPELSPDQMNQSLSKGKVFVMAALSMHSSEVAPTQSSPLIAYEVATSQDPNLLKWLENVVYMMIPSHNPDGMEKVINHYKKYKGTKYEGSSLPEVYHKYVGHDNNRDFVTLTQSDNRAIARLYSKSWLPQVMVEKHQMGSTGPRYFVPPMHDPIAENVDEQIWNWTRVFGSNMSKDMSNQNLAGVSQEYLFDDYWPGSTETAIWKNVIGMLTEAASVQVATPIYVEKSELQVGGKGLGEYKKSINMPLPWEGGWWHLSDIVEYELATTWSIIKTASNHKTEILQFRNDLCRKEILKGQTQAPYYYVLPANQKDPGELADLLCLLDEHGVQIHQLKQDLEHQSRLFRKGDYVISLAQPFRAFIKEVMEKQIFPERHYTPDGELIEPYDITSWSLPLHRGLSCVEIDTENKQIASSLAPVEFPLQSGVNLPESSCWMRLSAQSNENYGLVFAALQDGVKVYRDQKESGDFLVLLNDKTRPKLTELTQGITSSPVFQAIEGDGSAIPVGFDELKLPKIALVETIFHDMDAGWTRYVLDTYHIPFTAIAPADICEKSLKNYEVIILPDADKDLLVEAHYKGSGGSYRIPAYDPKILKGMGKKGQSALMKFIDEGGVVLSWGESTELFMGPQSIEISKEEKEEFAFPVSNIGPDLAKKGVQMPGSLLQIELKKESPLCWGMPATLNIFSRGTPVFATRIPVFDLDRRVVGSFPEQNILVSGYAQNEEKLAGKSALVWLKKGKGQLVLFGFSPIFRASTTSNYKLLFNGILLAD